MKAYYTYNIDIHENCPDGFNVIDGCCECDTKLKKLSQVLHTT